MALRISRASTGALSLAILIGTRTELVNAGRQRCQSLSGNWGFWWIAIEGTLQRQDGPLAASKVESLWHPWSARSEAATTSVCFARPDSFAIGPAFDIGKGPSREGQARYLANLLKIARFRTNLRIDLPRRTSGCCA
jgi:hypothetical protein